VEISQWSGKPGRRMRPKPSRWLHSKQTTAHNSDWHDWHVDRRAKIQIK